MGGTILAKIKIDGKLFDSVYFTSKLRTTCSEGFYETRDTVKPYRFTDILTRTDGTKDNTDLGVIEIAMYKVKYKSCRDHVATQPTPASKVSTVLPAFTIQINN